MLFTVSAAGFAIALLIGTFACLTIGRRLGVKRLANDPTLTSSGTAGIDAAVYGLLGLLLAFTFSGAASRFDERRKLIGAEANAVGTAYLRIDLLPLETQPPLRKAFREYVNERLAFYRQLDDLDSARAANARVEKAREVVWKYTVAALTDGGAATTAVVNAMNTMFDIGSSRLHAMRLHPPIVIYWLMAGLTLIAAILAGHGLAVSKMPQRLHMLIYALAMTSVVYVTIELEFPRMGLIRVDAADEILEHVAQSLR